MDDVRITRLGDGREIAYRVMSNTDGPALLHTSSPTFAMEMLVEDLMYERFLLTLDQCRRLVLFDKPGTGASDPSDSDRGYFEQLEEAYLAVTHSIGVPAAWLVVAASGTTTALRGSTLERSRNAATKSAALPYTSRRGSPPGRSLARSSQG